MSQSSEKSQKKDSPTRAPELGEPRDHPKTSSGASNTSKSEKSKPGNAKIGQDLESGRADAKP